MYSVLRDNGFTTRAVRDGRPMQNFKAKELLYRISDATWRCGDPGMQYDTTVNRWHTSKNTARINASNPCSEYMFLDDSACNLASLNLLKFAPNGTFDVEAYRHAVDVLITAQEILVDNAGYPTEMIAQELARLSSAGPGLRQPRRAADGRRPALRLRRRTRLRRLRHRHHVRRSLSAIVAHRRALPAISRPRPSPPKRLSILSRAQRVGGAERDMPGAACPGWYINREPFLDVIRMHRASGQQHQQDQRPSRALRSQQRLLGRSSGPRRKIRLPQLPGHGTRAHRNYWFHDGLRYDRD